MRCLHPAGAWATVRPNIDTKSAPPGTDLGGLGEGAQTCAPLKRPRPLRYGRWRQGVGRVPGPERAEGGSRCDSSAEGVGGAPGPKEASGSWNCLSGGLRRLGPRCSTALSRRCLRLSEALRPCSPSCCCHQPAKAAPRQGRGQGCPAPSRGGKVERCRLRAASRPRKTVKSNRACARSFPAIGPAQVW